MMEMLVLDKKIHDCKSLRGVLKAEIESLNVMLDDI